LVLDQAGYVEEASPIRRCIVEHVLALKWLAVEGNSVVDTVAEGHAKNARDKIKALSDAGWTSVDIADLQQIVTEIEGMPHDVSKSHLLHYAQRREQYGDAHDLPIYLTEVAKTHPSYESAVAYCSIEDGTLKMLPGPRVRDWSQIPFATTQLLDALLAVRHAFEPMPWADTLQAVLDDYRQVTDVVRKQDGLQPVNWDDDGYATV
jgi:hypothetical protein